METIKEEKKADLEQLLNILIEKGWKPRGLEAKRFDGEMYYAEIFEHYSNGTMFFDGVEYSIRELVSKESLLWQFVCENKLYNRQAYVWLTNVEPFNEEFGFNDYQFRLIESSLKDESELEQFLLDNIKVD